jgi:hypothetical protein
MTNSKRATEGFISIGHSLLWKRGIRHCNIGVKSLMWDNRRKVGVLTGFRLARLADDDNTGRNSQGPLAFLAMDLVEPLGVKEDIRRNPQAPLMFPALDLTKPWEEYDETRRFYRHDAESLAWSLIYLCFTTFKDGDGGNRTKSPNPLKGWFDPKYSISGKRSFWHQFRRRWHPDPHDAYLNSQELAVWLAHYWSERYGKQSRSRLKNEPLYEEPDHERVFTELLEIHEDELGSREELRVGYEELVEMTLKYRGVLSDQLVV